MLGRSVVLSLLLEASLTNAFPNMAEKLAESHLQERMSRSPKSYILLMKC